jgi:hypothetical protein
MLKTSFVIVLINVDLNNNIYSYYNNGLLLDSKEDIRDLCIVVALVDNNLNCSEHMKLVKSLR